MISVYITREEGEGYLSVDGILITRKGGHNMSKKWLKLALSSTMMFSTLMFNAVIGVSAAEISYDGVSEEHRVHKIENFTPTDPYRYHIDSVSATISQRYYTANRDTNGDVVLAINEVINTTDCYYRFLATNSSGTEFVPSKDQEFYIEKEGIQYVRFPASSVSDDGYIYLHFSMNPQKGNLHLCERDYKIPVDYEENKVITDDFLTVNTGQSYKVLGQNGQYLDFDATAARRSNGNVFLNLNILDTNTNVQFEHMVSDETVFLPSKFTKYSALKTDPLNISIYKDYVVSSKYIYLNIYFYLAGSGSYSVEHVRIPIV